MAVGSGTCVAVSVGIEVGATVLVGSGVLVSFGNGATVSVGIGVVVLVGGGACVGNGSVGSGDGRGVCVTIWINVDSAFSGKRSMKTIKPIQQMTIKLPITIKTLLKVDMGLTLAP